VVAAYPHSHISSIASLQLQHKLDRFKVADQHSQTEPSSIGSRSSISRTLGGELLTSDEQKQLQRQLYSPFVRQDIFYTGSITTLPEYKTSTDMAAYIQVISLCYQHSTFLVVDGSWLTIIASASFYNVAVFHALYSV